jgi:transcriptional regulator with XRE-family HTH domain
MSVAAMPRGSQADQSFGRRLRRERERRQIALRSIAENTKISMSLFADMERDDVSRWPSGIFRRSFIRAYAQAVGLDPDETAREFLERFPDPHDPSRAPLVTSADAATAAASPVPNPRGGESPAAAAQSHVPALRVITATRRTFVRGRVLPSMTDRLMAIGWDALIVLTLALLLYAAFGVLWIPLCLAMAVYYGAGVLLLGNTPGVCLCAPPPRPADSSRTTSLAGVARACVALMRSGFNRRRES